jgi:rhamnose transport system substrate-binding protein
MIDRRIFVRNAASLLLLTTVGGCGKPGQPESQATRIGFVAKSLGNGFFDAVHRGADEAAKSLGAEVIFTGPTTPTAEGQIEVINALVAQHVAAIAVSANDPDALVPALQRALTRGIKVVSFDSAVDPKGRNLHVAAASEELIGRSCAQLAADLAPGGHGKVAVVSATPTSTNQNAWLAQMRKALASFPGLQDAGVVYGDDVADKSYRETVALVKEHPDLAVVVSLSSVGLVAAAKAIEDQGLTGKVRVTGLGLPSELVGYVHRGVVPKFALGNPVDLGYATTEVAVRLARGPDPQPGQPIPTGRLGEITFDPTGFGALGSPQIYDASNVDQYAKSF